VKSKTAPKEMPRPPSPNPRHGASLKRRYCRISSRSGLRLNGFWLGLGPSDWASAARTFPGVFTSWLRQFASAPSSGHAVGAASGGQRPHSSRVLAFQASRQNPLRHSANVACNCPHTREENYELKDRPPREEKW